MDLPWRYESEVVRRMARLPAAHCQTTTDISLWQVPAQPQRILLGHQQCVVPRRGVAWKRRIFCNHRSVRSVEPAAADRL